jgi:hypothetical protein
VTAAVRLLIANLDHEASLRRAEGHHERALTRAATRTAAAMGSLLRVLGEDEDELWLPGPLAPERLTAGSPRPRLLPGTILPPTRQGPRLSWAPTDVASATVDGSLRAEEIEKGGASLHQLLWRLPSCPLDTAARFHRRTTHLLLAREMNVSLPGARVVRSIGEVEKALARDSGQRWIAKAPFSAAGRDRAILSTPLGDEDGRRVGRLLRLHSELVLEPWVTRHADVGLIGVCATDGPVVLSLHLQTLDSRGRCHEILLALDRGVPPGIDDRVASQMTRVARRIGERMHGEGYRGPFGIDGFLHGRDPDRAELHPLCEINARMTLGLLARCAAERLVSPLPGPARVQVRFALGPRIPDSVADGEVIPLLFPDAAHPLGIWLESTSCGGSSAGRAGASVAAFSPADSSLPRK